MAINNHKQMIDAEIEGRVRCYAWRKAPTQATSAGRWFDLSMSPGNPPPKYWFDATPAIAKAVAQSTDGGLFHGANVSPSTKYLRSITAGTVTSNGLPTPLILCDYLLYYPSLDDSVTDPQVLDNSVTLPRYTDGYGVMIMPITLAARTGGQNFYVTYTNSDGVAGRVSGTCRQDTAAVIGSITTTAGINNAANFANPFIPLQQGDVGVRSVQSVTMLGADVGLFALVLVRPLAQIVIRSTTAVYEKDLFLSGASMPIIQDDAYLSLVGYMQGSVASTVYIGNLKVIWD